MPFPSDAEHLISAGYVFNRSETCSQCGESVEIWTTPGKREIAMNLMCLLLSPAVRHYETCNTAPKQEAKSGDVQKSAGRISNGGTPGNISGFQNGNHVQRSGQEVLRNGGRDAGDPQIKLFGVTDKNIIAVGWLAGTLAIQFRYGRYHYANVPEDVFTKIRNNPFPNNMFVKLVKNHPELYPCRKVG